MDELQVFAYSVFKGIRTAVAFSGKQMMRQHGLRNHAVRVFRAEEGPVYEESLEGVTLRLWFSLDGPRDRFINTNVHGFFWARIDTEESEGADLCIGAIVGTVTGREWIAVTKGFGDFNTSGLIVSKDLGVRPGADRLIEVRQEFEIKAIAKWAGREIDKHLGGGGCA